MKIHFLHAFSDNYIWVIETEPGQCVVVDPGEAATLEHYLQTHHLSLAAILITHTHADHIGGVAALQKNHTPIIYGPKHAAMPKNTQVVEEGDCIRLNDDTVLNVIHAPGHKDEHLCYYGASFAFTGDTLFAGGCGRLFEGTPQQMHASLAKLANLPDDTRIYCAHEYTQANLHFAHHIAPEHEAINARLARVNAQRAANECTLPSTIAIEKQTNPFLLCHDATFRAQVRMATGQCPEDPVQAFAYLRQLKDNF